MLATAQTCPDCDGHIEEHNTARTTREDSAVYYAHCEFCGVVFEREEYLDGYSFKMDYRRRTEPDNYRRALARLEEARF
jgi:transcription elongation factor Elf1